MLKSQNVTSINGIQKLNDQMSRLMTFRVLNTVLVR